MKKDNILASYLINLGEEVFRLLQARGAKKKMLKISFKTHSTKFIH